MEIYIGEKYLERAKKANEKKKFSFSWQGEKIFIISNDPLLFEISLGRGEFLIIWGQIHGICNSDKNYFKIEKNKESELNLKELFRNYKLNLGEVIGRIEGHFTGLILSSYKEVILFGDLYNRKDIFYVLDDNNLIASSRLEPLMNLYKPKKYNQVALANLLSIYGNYTPKKQTIYEGVSRLGVGERLEYKKNKILLKEIPFCGMNTRHYRTQELEEYANLLHSAIDLRSSAEMNWVFLSSGWDSSSILAHLTKIHGPSKIRAVIGRCRHTKQSGIINQFEVDRAKDIADYFSVPMDIIDIDYTKQEYLDNLQKINGVFKSNHLYCLSSYNFMRLAEHISKRGSQSDAIFNGEISDGCHNLGFSQFATILEHPELDFREYSDKMASYLFGPSFFSRVLEGKDPNKDLIYSLFKSRTQGLIFEDTSGMDQNVIKSKFMESFFLRGLRIPFVSLCNSNLLTENGREEYASILSDCYFKKCTRYLTPENIYSWILYLYNSFHWQGGSVKGLSFAPNHYNLNASMPFWDNRIQSFLSTMPESWGRGLELKPTKYPLKWTLQNKVDYPHHLQTGPHSYLYDVDPDWNGDGEILYGSFGTSYFRECLKNYQYEDILSNEYFNLEYLKNLTDNYCDGIEVKGSDISILNNLVGLCTVGWY